MGVEGRERERGRVGERKKGGKGRGGREGETMGGGGRIR